MKMKWPGFNKKGTVIISLSTESFWSSGDSILIKEIYIWGQSKN